MTQDPHASEATPNQADGMLDRIEMLGDEIEAKVSDTAKKWWRSKTLLVNAAVLMLAEAEHQLNFLQPLLPVNVYALIAFGLPVVNAALRFVTTQGIKL